MEWKTNVWVEWEVEIEKVTDGHTDGDDFTEIDVGKAKVS